MTKLFEQSKPQRNLVAARNGKMDAVVTAADQADFGVINGLFLSEGAHVFLESIGKYFLFPIAAAAHVFKTILAWRQAWIDRKQRSVVAAIVETLAAAAVVAAVVGALVAGGMFALATPILFTAAIGGKTLYQAGSAIYYAGKASGQKDQVKKDKYRKLAINNGLGAAAGAVATAAVVAVFLLGKIALAGIGVAAAVVGVGVAIYKGYRMHKAEQAAKAAIELEQYEPVSTGPSPAERLNNTNMHGKLVLVGGKEVAKQVVDDDDFGSDNEKGAAKEVIVNLGHGMDGSLDRPVSEQEAHVKVVSKSSK